MMNYANLAARRSTFHSNGAGSVCETRALTRTIDVATDRFSSWRLGFMKSGGSQIQMPLATDH
jgi:hypothetical protein